MPNNTAREHMTAADMARALKDIQERAAEVHGDLDHLVANFHVSPGAESLQIGARLALEP